MPRRPTSSPIALIARATVAVAVLAALLAAPVAAHEPPSPLPGYRPVFVTEAEGSGKWQDCIWAASSMLLDKWTNGATQVDRERLRHLADAPAGGSSFGDVARAFARLGFDLAFTGDGRTTITWRRLLGRLAAGGGAVLLGDQHNLPRRYGRWDPKFWANTGVDDNHAVYVERYNPRTGMVWLMDPLARGDWNGEWVRASALYRYAWKMNGGVVAAMTPAAKAAPFAGVRVRGATALSATAFSLTATWSITRPRGWTFRGADVTIAAKPIAAAAIDPAEAVVVAPLMLPGEAPSAADKAGVRATAGSLAATAALPSTPGVYQVSMRVTDRRFGRLVSVSRPVILYRPGPRSAAITAGSTSAVIAQVAGGMPVRAGDTVPVSIAVRNSGSTSWADSTIRADSTARLQAPSEPTAPLNTRMTGTWILVAPADAATADAAPTPAVVGIGPAALAPGGSLLLNASVPAPSVAGRWALVLQVTDDAEGSFTASGSAPSILFFDVVAAADAAGGAA